MPSGTLIPAAMLAALATASVAAQAPAPPQRLTAADQARLDSALAGRVAGPPQRCLQPQRARRSTTIGSTTVLFRDGRTVWRNELVGRCPGLRFGDAIATVTPGGRICEGDIAQTVDLVGGSGLSGGCAWGPFVPYRK